MLPSSRIFVAGHRGMVGSAIHRLLLARGYADILTRSRDELDLADAAAVRAFFERERPEYVFLAAARVGGILANRDYPADFIADNLAIELNVIRAAYEYGAKKLLFLGSSCIYPRDCPQPIREEYLLTGALEPTNRPYALAKIAGIELCRGYARQHGANFIACMPTNLYGPGDNFHPEGSHVIPGMIRKFHDAKESGAASVTLWGDGSPYREFLHVDDMAAGCLALMLGYDATPERAADGDIFLNIGTGRDVTIRELAEAVRETVGYRGEIAWDTSKPNGTPRKLLDVSRMRDELGWEARIGLRDGLADAYSWFLEHAA